MGLSRFELLTPRLSSVCSNQLSYRPEYILRIRLDSPRPTQAHALASCRQVPTTQLVKEPGHPGSFKTRQACIPNPSSTRSISSVRSSGSDLAARRLRRDVSRKEVIQPQVLLQLPCYDFTPITDHTLGACLPCGLAQLLLVQPAFVM